MTAHVWMLFWNSWRTFKGHFADPNRSVSIVPGEFIDVDPQRNEYLELMGGEPVPPELMNTAGIVDSYIQRNGVAQGPRTQEGTRSAQQVWAIQSIRQLKVEPAKQSLQQGIERLLMLTSRILVTRLPDERLTMPVPGRDREGSPIGEVSIAVSDLESYEEAWDVTFGRRLDPAVLEQAKAVMGLAANNWMPRMKSWELSGLTESPEEWEDELYIQQVGDLDFMKEVGAWEQLVAYYGPDSWQVQYYQQRMQQPPPTRGRGGGGMPPAQQGLMRPTQPTALPPGPALGGGPAPGRSAPVGGRLGQAAPRNGMGGGMPGQTTPGVPSV